MVVSDFTGSMSATSNRSEDRTSRSLSEQVVNLKNSTDRQMALQRVTRASQVVIARTVILHALAVLSGR